ncbi:hypothetical protein BTVI_113940 [Pitangus sulphuratus]|nr:hypothetical protein BTVI_113940 [Pitangus sulphuratus]
MLKSAGPKTELCRNPLVTERQPDVTQFTITLCATCEPVAHPPCNRVIELCAGDFVQKDAVRDSIQSFDEVQKDYIYQVSYIS